MNDDVPVPMLLTIRETSEKLGISRHYLRKLCLTNVISYKKAGNRYLINVPKLIAYLNESDG